MRPISKLEDRVANFFTHNRRKLDDQGQRFSSEPTQTELAQFLDPDHYYNLRVRDDIERLSVSAALLPYWLVLIGAGILFAGAIWAPQNELEEEPWPLAARLLGCLALSLLFLMFVYTHNAVQKTKGVHFIFDKLKRSLELPRYKITLSTDQMHSLFLLQSKNLSGFWTCELSVITRLGQGEFVRYSLGIDARPKRIYKLSRTLAEYTGISLGTLKLNRKTLKTLGLDLKTVFGKGKFIGQTEQKGTL